MWKLVSFAFVVALAACASGGAKAPVVAPSRAAAPCPVHVVDGVAQPSTCSSPSKTDAAKCDAAPAYVVDGIVRGCATASADSIGARLVELEFERVSSNAVSKTQPQTASQLSTTIASLHARLRALPNGDAVDRVAQDRVILALDTRAATLGASIESARLFYTDQYPPVRDALNEKRLIIQRLAEISKR